VPGENESASADASLVVGYLPPLLAFSKNT
jgi:hypothetical protein